MQIIKHGKNCWFTENGENVSQAINEILAKDRIEQSKGELSK